MSELQQELMPSEKKFVIVAIVTATAAVSEKLINFLKSAIERSSQDSKTDGYLR